MSQQPQNNPNQNTNAPAATGSGDAFHFNKSNLSNLSTRSQTTASGTHAILASAHSLAGGMHFSVPSAAPSVPSVPSVASVPSGASSASSAPSAPLAAAAVSSSQSSVPSVSSVSSAAAPSVPCVPSVPDAHSLPQTPANVVNDATTAAAAATVAGADEQKVSSKADVATVTSVAAIDGNAGGAPSAAQTKASGAVGAGSQSAHESKESENKKLSEFEADLAGKNVKETIDVPIAKRYLLIQNLARMVCLKMDVCDCLKLLHKIEKMGNAFEYCREFIISSCDPYYADPCVLGLFLAIGDSSQFADENGHIAFRMNPAGQHFINVALTKINFFMKLKLKQENHPFITRPDLPEFQSVSSKLTGKVQKHLDRLVRHKSDYTFITMRLLYGLMRLVRDESDFLPIERCAHRKLLKLLLEMPLMDKFIKDLGLIQVGQNYECVLKVDPNNPKKATDMALCDKLISNEWRRMEMERDEQDKIIRGGYDVDKIASTLLNKNMSPREQADFLKSQCSPPSATKTASMAEEKNDNSNETDGMNASNNQASKPTNRCTKRRDSELGRRTREEASIPSSVTLEDESTETSSSSATLSLDVDPIVSQCKGLPKMKILYEGDPKEAVKGVINVEIEDYKCVRRSGMTPYELNKLSYIAADVVDGTAQIIEVNKIYDSILEECNDGKDRDAKSEKNGKNGKNGKKKNKSKDKAGKSVKNDKNDKNGKKKVSRAPPKKKKALGAAGSEKDE